MHGTIVNRRSADRAVPRRTLSPVELEQTAREVAAQWGVELGRPFALSNYSYVAPGGEDAVLKVVSPDDDESDHEPDALAFWAGDGAVRLLRRDAARKVLLLERARPGTDLSRLPEDEAVRIAIAVGRRIWRDPGGGPYLSAWENARRWLGNVEPAHELLPRAAAALRNLEPRTSVLLHGDFHHHNLLSHGDGWVAIDPKPALGEPEYDIPPFLWNPIGSALTAESVARRIDAFAAAGLDPDRIRAWALVRATILGWEQVVPLLP
jgi:streptomycin 6-kinase